MLIVSAGDVRGEMNLPDFFIADLPPEASITTELIADACQTLKRNRALFLRDRSTHSLVRALTDLAASWLEPDYRFRRMALAAPPEQTGFPTATLAHGLDTFFRRITAEHLEQFMIQELGHRARLDEFCASGSEQQLTRASLVRGPDLIAHITAGNLPIPALWCMILGLLARSAQFVKCASKAALLPRLFAHSLYEADRKLGACLEIAEWPGGNTALENALFSEADCVTATGSDETLAAVRERLPLRVRFLGYGHRVSFGYITREALSGFDASRVAARAGTDVIAWNQLGCLSPHLFYVETGGRTSPEEFAEMLAGELARTEMTEPRGSISPAAASDIANRRSFYEIRAAHSPDTKLWASKESTAWTVVYEADPRFQVSCLHRFIYVKPVADLNAAIEAADSMRGCVSTVGIEAPEDRVGEIAAVFGRWGVTRVCPLGRMQDPNLAWRHDGRPALADLVTWVDWERSG